MHIGVFVSLRTGSYAEIESFVHHTFLSDQTSLSSDSQSFQAITNKHYSKESVDDHV